MRPLHTSNGRNCLVPSQEFGYMSVEKIAAVPGRVPTVVSHATQPGYVTGYHAFLLSFYMYATMLALDA